MLCTHLPVRLLAFFTCLYIHTLNYLYVCCVALERLSESSEYDIVRSQARGALWILRGNEQKTSTTISTKQSSTAAAGLASCTQLT